MFHSARLKLTAWYLVIIMLISALFSISIYRIQANEFENWYQHVQLRYLQQQYEHPDTTPPMPLEQGYLQSTEQRLAMNLIFINAIILVLSGISSYLLAGITLRPIKDMVDEQKQFITDASHELRTPLTSLRSEIEVNLRDKHLSLEEAKTLLRSNLEEVDNLQILSDSLLALIHPHKAPGKGLFENVVLADIIAEAVKKVSPMAKKKHITVETQVGSEIVKGDRQNLIQLFVIFLDNGVKYSPAKTKISIWSSQSDSFARIVIQDQGIGIEKKDIPHIFDRFYRADSSRTKRQVQGYGLGLSIAMQIVKAHKGSITVESERGKGSIFSLVLPLSPR